MLLGSGIIYLNHATEIHVYQNHAKQGLPVFAMKNKETQWEKKKISKPEVSY